MKNNVFNTGTPTIKHEISEMKITLPENPTSETFWYEYVMLVDMFGKL